MLPQRIIVCKSRGLEMGFVTALLSLDAEILITRRYAPLLNEGSIPFTCSMDN
jgi:hypothetical protein